MVAAEVVLKIRLADNALALDELGLSLVERSGELAVREDLPLHIPPELLQLAGDLQRAVSAGWPGVEMTALRVSFTMTS